MKLMMITLNYLMKLFNPKMNCDEIYKVQVHMTPAIGSANPPGESQAVQDETGAP